MRFVWLALVLAGCGRLGFEEALGVPSHVAGGVPEGTATLALVDATIDTSALTIDGATRDDFDAHEQAHGPEVAVLRVSTFDVSGTVRVVGSRPFIVYASGEIQIDGLIDAGAHREEPGAGGHVDGPGRGSALGKPIAGVCDPGGGGGGFGEDGASGGAEGCRSTFGAGGARYGDAGLFVLEGGSGGGNGSPGECPVVAAGAGGGAIQLTSLSAVRVGGGINVGGGGGGGGPYCGTDDGGAGGGGGAGGAIFLEAPVVQANGALHADGGGGGAGGNGNSGNGTVGSGADGEDASLAGPGAGGVTDVGTSGSGGIGGGVAAGAMSGADASINPGGGGGAVGRIVVRTL